MALLGLGDRFGLRDASTTVYECRRCGLSVDAEAEVCPSCETASIARYEVS